jgi:hypothetical protein
MSMKHYQRVLMAGLAAAATLGVAAAAQAEPITYQFTGSIQSANEAELGATGLPTTGEITGSFTYDPEAGWNGGSNVWSDGSMSFTIDGMSPTTTSSVWLGIEYNQGVFTIDKTAYSDSINWLQAEVLLNGQSAPVGDLPTSLSLDGNGTGTLSLFINDSGSADLVATITSLAPPGAATSTPELDPASGAGALALLLGGAAVMLAGRRRRLIGTH